MSDTKYKRSYKYKCMEPGCSAVVDDKKWRRVGTGPWEMYIPQPAGANVSQSQAGDCKTAAITSVEAVSAKQKNSSPSVSASLAHQHCRLQASLLTSPGKHYWLQFPFQWQKTCRTRLHLQINAWLPRWLTPCYHEVLVRHNINSMLLRPTPNWGSVEQQLWIRVRLTKAAEVYTDCLSRWELETMRIHPVL